jgi:hypothetical protein
MSKKLELLNSEGPILVLHKSPNLMLEFKQIKEIQEIDEDILEKFLNGDLLIETTDGTIWNYNEFSEGMKQSKQTIKNFLNN